MKFKEKDDCNDSAYSCCYKRGVGNNKQGISNRITCHLYLLPQHYYLYLMLFLQR